MAELQSKSLTLYLTKIVRIVKLVCIYLTEWVWLDNFIRKYVRG